MDLKTPNKALASLVSWEDEFVTPTATNVAVTPLVSKIKGLKLSTTPTKRRRVSLGSPFFPRRVPKMKHKVTWSNGNSLSLDKVCSFLSPSEVVSVLSTSRSWRAAVDTPAVWKSVFIQKYPGFIGENSFAESWKELAKLSTPKQLLNLTNGNMWIDKHQNIPGFEFTQAEGALALGMVSGSILFALEVLPGFFWVEVATNGDSRMNYRTAVFAPNSLITDVSGYEDFWQYWTDSGLENWINIDTEAVALLMLKFGVLPVTSTPSALATHFESYATGSKVKLGLELYASTVMKLSGAPGFSEVREQSPKSVLMGLEDENLHPDCFAVAEISPNQKWVVTPSKTVSKITPASSKTFGSVVRNPYE